MKKKGILLVVLLFLLTVAVVYLGYSYSNKQQEELIHVTSTAVETEDTGNNEETTEVIDPSVYEEKRDQLSVLDYLKYIGTQNEETAIAFYGQLPEEESWTGSAVSTLETELESEVTATSLTRSETDSYDLYITTAAQDLAETNAAVVFFMMPVLGDYVRDISLENSASYLSRNVTAIKEVLPDTLVVLVSPSPNSSGINDYNSRMLDYVGYMESGVEEATENNWPLLDMHTAYMDKLEAENSELTAVLQEDGYSLTPQGEEMMAELFMEQLKVPVDTTSGLQ